MSQRRKGIAQLVCQGGKELVLASICFAQRILGALALGEISADLGEAHHDAGGLVDRGRNLVDPDPLSPLCHAPSFTLDAANSCGFLELSVGQPPSAVLRRIHYHEMFPYYLVGPVAD